MNRRTILTAMVLMAGALASGQAALAQPLPTDRSDLAYSYAPLVKRVSPAVVNIYTCLLYTSPSPRDGLLSRMPSSA